MPELPHVSSRSRLSRGKSRQRSRRDHHALRQRVPGGSIRYRIGEVARGHLRYRTSRAATRMLNLGKTEPFDDLDRLSPDALQRWWTRKLKRALRVAFEELPFYRERFAAAGSHPKEFRTLDDIRKVPICT